MVQSTHFIPSVTLTPPVEPSSSALPDNDIFITNRYILLDKEVKVIFLDVESKIVMDRYVGKRALITGLFDSSAKTIQISTPEDIEIIR